MAHTTEGFGSDAFAQLQESFALFSWSKQQTMKVFMCEVESILNSRPITAVSDDSGDIEPLTPNHLLLLKSDSPMSPGVFQEEDLFSWRRWRIQYLSDIFWKRWSKEYLPLLQSWQKWMYPRKNLAVGDIVLVSVENTSRNSWPLGRIQEVSRQKGIHSQN